MALKILIVDDSATIRFQVSRALQSAGYTVVDAADGALALEALAREPDVRLVVCDINMPNMSGLEFLERLTPEQRRIPVVVLTTESDIELSARAKALGAKGWILKPFKADLLVSAVKKLTE